MELKLQSILFPDKEEYTDNADLFYKGGLGIRDAEEKCFVFSKYSTCDFGAYLNAFSMKMCEAEQDRTTKSIYKNVESISINRFAL